MTSSEWHAEMRRTMKPHLDDLRKDISSCWPSLDPELLLVRWLCERNNLDLPDQVLAEVSTEPAVDAEPQQRKPVGNLRPHRKSLVVAASIVEWEATDAPTPTESPKCNATRIENRRSEARKSAQMFISNQRRESWNKNVSLARFVKKSTASFDENLADLHASLESTTLRSLSGIADKIERDTQRLDASDERRRNQVRLITGGIAQMRQELRGKFLAKVPLLSLRVLTRKEQFKLVGKLRPWTYQANHDIIKEGDVGDKLFIIERGVCEAIKRVNKRETVVGKFGKGAFFGEIAVMYDIPRTATVRAATDVTVLSLSREDMSNTISGDHFQRMRVVASTQVFSSIPLLSDLPSDMKVRVAENMKSTTHDKGAILAGHSHITTRMYIIEEGTALMEIKGSTPTEAHSAIADEIAKGVDRSITLGPGQFIGMRGLLYGAPFGANITVSSPTLRALSISHDELLATARTENERETMACAMRLSMQSHLLRQIPQLGQMADDFFETIRAHAEVVDFLKWQVVAAQGADLDAVYVLEKGKLVEHDGGVDDMMNLDLKEVNGCERQTPGEFFGVECLTNKHAKAPLTLVALTDCTLLRIPPNIVWSVLSEERQHVARIPFFSQHVLTKSEQYMLVGKLKPWKFSSGRSIITQGEMGDLLFIIERGSCNKIQEINGQEVVVAQLKKGGYFGEVAVIYDMPQAATVRAVTDVVAVSISREDIIDTISPEKWERMRIIARTQIFNSIPLLQNLTTKQKMCLAENLQTERWGPGSVIAEASEQTTRLYIIEEGQVRMSHEVAHQPESDAQPRVLLAGEYFGMRGLLWGSPMCCTFTASTACEVRTLSIAYDEVLNLAGPGERQSIARTMRDSMWILLLRQIPELKVVSEEFLQTLFNDLVEPKFEATDIVVAQGGVIHSLYILLEGRLQQHDHATGDTTEHSALGYFFGAECVSRDEVLSPYEVVALTRCVLLQVPKHALQSTVKRRISI